MDKLIITITCDSTMSFPRNPHNPTPKGISAIAKEYVRSVEAGAAICHLHGPYTVDEKVQADGTKLSDLDIPGWGRLRQEIVDRCQPIIQYGIANGRFPQRKQLLQEQRPDMVPVCHNAHDECFDYDPGHPPVELYGLHNRDELVEYAKLCGPLGVKIEAECFHYGGVWNASGWSSKGCSKSPSGSRFPRLEGRLLDPAHAQGHAIYARPPARRLHLQHFRDGPGRALAGVDDGHSLGRARPRRHGRQSVPLARPIRHQQRPTGRKDRANLPRVRPRNRFPARGTPNHGKLRDQGSGVRGQGAEVKNLRTIFLCPEP